MILLYAILALLYASVDGTRDAFYYHLSGFLYKKMPNIHWLYVIQRGLFAIILFFLTNFFVLIFFILSFSLFHNGFYYYTRNKLNDKVYPKRFIDTSTTSKAIIEFSFKERLLLFIFGIIFLILNYTI